MLWDPVDVALSDDCLSGGGRCLARAEVHITCPTAVIGGTPIEGTTKSGRSRTVSVDAGTVQVLKEHRARQAVPDLGWVTAVRSRFSTAVSLKSHMSPVGASRERENRDRCGEVPGGGCCRLVVLPADSAEGRCAGDWGGLLVVEADSFPGIGVR